MTTKSGKGGMEMGKKKKSKGRKGRADQITAHQCALAKERKFKKVRKIVKSPEFVCRGCLRVADKKGNLCKPSALSEI